MAMDYYSLPSFKAKNIDSVSGKTADLVSALKKNRDFTLHEILQNDDGADCIVVSVETDGVPTNNPYNIHYKEKLAIFVSCDLNLLPSVYALRKDFPVTIHQYSSHTDEPCGLCLYGERSSNVLRNWTPQQFLRRIQWWLTAAATGSLHAEDQALEPLFYESKNILILPHDFDQIAQSNDIFYVWQLPGTDEVPTNTMRIIPRSYVPKEKREHLIPLVLIYTETSPLTHGYVEKDPTTIGELGRTLSRRGSDLYKPFRDAVHNLMPTDGIEAESDRVKSIVIIKIPVKRSEDEPVENYLYKGYLLDGNPLLIGKGLGIVSLMNGRYFKISQLGTLNKNETDKIFDNQSSIYSLEILFSLTPDGAKKQSNITDSNPEGVIIGVGALGSTILELWGRSGWGRWQVVDNDIIRPHNLVRHICSNDQIGQSKSEAVVAKMDDIFPRWNTLKGLHFDACDIEGLKDKGVFENKDFVLDVSTSLDYPRKASTHPDLPRHITAFVTPNAKNAVMIVEDRERQSTLDSLEAQYYRAIIQNESGWGENHLAINSTIRTGNGCSDISSTISYSDICTFAGILSEQVRLHYLNALPQILIWQKKQTGEISHISVKCYRKVAQTIGEYIIVLDQGLLEKLLDFRQEHVPNETGGILVGYHDLPLKKIFIVDGFKQPSDSRGSPSGFSRGTHDVGKLVAEVQRSTNEIVYYLGEWHSHPNNAGTLPSTYDRKQLSYLAHRMSEDGLPAIQLIMGENTDEYTISLEEYK